MTWTLRFMIAAVSFALCGSAHAQSWSMQLSAEAGVGLRNIDIPRDSVVYEVRTGMYPVLGVGFDLAYHASKQLSVSLMGRYQSSIGLILHEQLTDGTDHPRKTRSHRVEFGLSSRLKLGEQGWALQGVIGYALSELDPENHLETPSYYFGGPYASIMFHMPLGSERLSLGLGPQGQLIVSTGSELSERGVASSGVAAGFDAALAFSFNERWSLALSYRELHAWLTSQQAGAGFTDVTRLTTVQLRGRL